MASNFDDNLMINGILQFQLLTNEECDEILSKVKKIKLEESGSSLHKYGIEIGCVKHDFP